MLDFLETFVYSGAFKKQSSEFKNIFLCSICITVLLFFLSQIVSLSFSSIEIGILKVIGISKIIFPFFPIFHTEMYIDGQRRG